MGAQSIWLTIKPDPKAQPARQRKCNQADRLPPLTMQDPSPPKFPTSFLQPLGVCCVQAAAGPPWGSSRLAGSGTELVQVRTDPGSGRPSQGPSTAHAPASLPGLLGECPGSWSLPDPQRLFSGLWEAAPAALSLKAQMWSVGLSWGTEQTPCCPLHTPSPHRPPPTPCPILPPSRPAHGK